MSRSSRVSKIVRASPAEVYEAFIDPAVLVEWLPPGEMTGRIHDFDARPGGGYSMSLFYPAGSVRGKTSAREDRVRVRFVELAPPHRIVEAVTFDTTDPALMGEMVLVATLTEVSGGTEVTIACHDLPPGVGAADNETGSRESLENLARRFG